MLCDRICWHSRTTGTINYEQYLSLITINELTIKNKDPFSEAELQSYTLRH
jgi:hypothetical protein